MENNIEDLIKDVTESVMLSYKRGHEDGTRKMSKDIELHKDTNKMLVSFAEYLKDYTYMIDGSGMKHYSNDDYIYTEEQLIREFLLKYGY